MLARLFGNAWRRSIRLGLLLSQAGEFGFVLFAQATAAQLILPEAASLFGAVVVLSMAIQATKNTEQVLREMSQIGTTGIVSFPNFGHWTHAWSILRGRMPVSREMPYQWYDTPNLHLATPRDFESLLEQLDLKVTDRAFLADGKPVGWLAAQRATQAFYRFCARAA